MVAFNDITKDKIASKTVSKSYRDNYDAIFNQKVPIITDIKEFQCSCGNTKGSFVRFYSKEMAICPHCQKEYILKDYTKVEIQHQR